MAPLRTIAVALDFSPGSEAALIRAATLAARTGAMLHAVHADPGGAFEARNRELTAFIAAALGPEAVGSVRLAVVGGPSVVASLLRYTTSVEADLLVLGTHGRSGPDRFLVGSVAESCVAAAPCPVLAVPHSVTAYAPSPEAPILVAVDFTPLSRSALALGQRQAALYGAPIEAVHVVRDLGPYTGFSPSALSLDALDPERAADVRRRLARFAGEHAPDALHVALGTASRQIARLADERRAGLVVMGTHGRSGTAHSLIGSTAGATLQRAPCPVLTVRQPPASAPPKRPESTLTSARAA